VKLALWIEKSTSSDKTRESRPKRQRDLKKSLGTRRAKVGNRDGNLIRLHF